MFRVVCADADEFKITLYIDPAQRDEISEFCSAWTTPGSPYIDQS